MLFAPLLCLTAVTRGQVIEKGLALAKPRDCKSDDGVKVQRTLITAAATTTSTSSSSSSTTAATPAPSSVKLQSVIVHHLLLSDLQLSRNAFKNWVKQLAVKEHWTSSKVCL